MASVSSLVVRFAVFIHLFLAIVVASHSHNHNHQKLANTFSHASRKAENKTLSDVEKLVQEAIKAAAIRNKARLESPHFNKDEFASPSREPSLAPPLRIVNETSTLSAREISQQNVSSSAYTIPPEVVEAARIMAESTPQQPAGDHADIAARIKQKYSHKLNDTNAPKHLGTPEGRLGAWAMPDSVGNSSEVLKRDSSYWMLSMPQLGSNPYAPSGYKVRLHNGVPFLITHLLISYRYGGMSKTLGQREMVRRMIRLPLTLPFPAAADAVQIVALALFSLPLSIFPQGHILSAHQSFSITIPNYWVMYVFPLLFPIGDVRLI